MAPLTRRAFLTGDITGGAPNQVKLWQTLAALRTLADVSVDKIVRALAGTKRLDIATLQKKSGFADDKHTMSLVEALCAHGLAVREEAPAPNGGQPAFLYRLNADGFRALAAGLTQFAEAI